MKKKFKPYKITFRISSEDEADAFLTLLEKSPHLFKDVMDDIKYSHYYNSKENEFWIRLIIGIIVALAFASIFILGALGL